MNKAILCFVIAMLVPCIFAIKKDPGYRMARQNGAEVQLKLFVSDENKTVVPNADIRVFMGMNFRPKGYWIEGKTDGHGLFVIKGKTCGDEVEIHVSKDGYYSSKRKLCFVETGVEHDVENGRWVPYGATETIQLRRIRNPVSLRKSGFGMGRDVSATNLWIGVDMAVGDFLSPYGKGEISDFEINVEWDGRPPVGCSYCVATLRFSGKLSGGYYAQKEEESDYPYVYTANTNDVYDIRQIQVIGRDGARRTDVVPFGRNSVLVTRTRCVLDDRGRLKSANYGYIRILDIDAGWDQKPTMRFSCVFNPNPNDTNLESKR